ncbi:hypothetical protein [Paenibacillus hamazuiensis]|uniref:hypothetical protein n=1 Tax=Paenibacillus hamazuiensis TaxID=2936508 RepID=UPI00200D1AAE|nr:hypothetical protein [Paenibacillus hamazuiensis]
MKIGQGEFQYEVVNGWARLPEHASFGYTHGIVVDSEDNVYLFHTGAPSLMKFDREGRYLSGWGEFPGAHGCLLHEEADEAYLYLTDTKLGIVVKTTLDGKEVLRIGTPEMEGVYDTERRFVPTDVAVAPNGDIYVADGYGQSWVHRYDRRGERIQSWGGKGSEPGQMSCPHGVSVCLRGKEPELYVADRGNNRIQVFTLDGVHKRFVTDDLDMPCSFYFRGGETYIPDLHSRVTILDGGDRLIAHLGEDPEAFRQTGWPNLQKSYFRPDKFSSPHGICVDSKGDVYVSEWISDGRVTKLKRM